jgi:hypothetical protein
MDIAVCSCRKNQAGHKKVETELTYLIIFVAFILGLVWISLPKKKAQQRPHHR